MPHLTLVTDLQCPLYLFYLSAHLHIAWFSQQQTSMTPYLAHVCRGSSDAPVLHPCSSAVTLSIFGAVPPAEFFCFFFNLFTVVCIIKNNRYVECAFSIYTQTSLCLIPHQKRKRKKKNPGIIIVPSFNAMFMRLPDKTDEKSPELRD